MNKKRNDNLISFLRLLTPADKISIIQKILFEGGVKIIFAEESREFFERRFHYLISRYCFDLFSNGHYFHAVFEAVKIYNKVVKEKSNNTKDGVSLMMEVWSPEGVLKVTKCETETERNFQNGLKFLSAGLMQAIRNPVAHEPEFEWPISKEDCLDLLSFISYLLRQVDRAVYYK